MEDKKDKGKILQSNKFVFAKQEHSNKYSKDILYDLFTFAIKFITLLSPKLTKGVLCDDRL